MKFDVSYRFSFQKNVHHKYWFLRRIFSWFVSHPYPRPSTDSRLGAPALREDTWCFGTPVYYCLDQTKWTWNGFLKSHSFTSSTIQGTWYDLLLQSLENDSQRKNQNSDVAENSPLTSLMPGILQVVDFMCGFYFLHLAYPHFLNTYWCYNNKNSQVNFLRQSFVSTSSFNRICSGIKGQGRNPLTTSNSLIQVMFF